MRIVFLHTRIALIASTFIAIGGCADPNRPNLVTAAGEVMFKGKPLTAGSIIFFPEKDAEYQADSPTSLLQIDGTFTMKTYPFGEGVAPGTYKVCLNKSLASAIQLPAYGDPQRTPWKVEIPPTGDPGILLQVE